MNLESNDFIRMDSSGSGLFGARRGGGTRKHKGLDIIRQFGEPVLAPERGYIKEIRYPYVGSKKISGFKFIGDSGISYLVFYVGINKPLKMVIDKGEEIGKAQNISGYHNDKNMINHIHIETYKDGILVNPEDILKKK